MFNKFDEDLKKPNTKSVTYKGNAAIYDIDRESSAGSVIITHTKRIVTDFGMYILMVVAEEANQNASDIRIFFNSLKTKSEYK